MDKSKGRVKIVNGRAVVAGTNKNGRELSVRRMDDDVNLSKVVELTRRPKLEIIHYLQEMQLITRKYLCCECKKPMRLVEHATSQDGYAWECRSNEVVDPHVTTRSIRKGSWVSLSSLKLEEMVLLTFLFLQEYPAQLGMDELKLSSRVVNGWFKYLRDVCQQIVFTRNKRIGGPKVVVDIDDFLFTYRRQKDRVKEEQWVFGGVCRNSNDCFLATIDKRTPRVALEIIKEKLLPGSILISKCWQTYNCYNSAMYQHLVTSEVYQFESPDTAHHKRNVERLFNHVSSCLPDANKKKVVFNSYLCEFMYRQMFLDATNKLECFFKDAASTWPPKHADNVYA